MDSLEFMNKAKELVCTVYNDMMGTPVENYVFGGDKKYIEHINAQNIVTGTLDATKIKIPNLSDGSDEDSPLTTKDVYVVWLSKTLQNGKAMLSTTRPDGMYYEVTYNGDKNEFYVDAYKKVINRRFGLPKEDQQDEK